MDFGSITVSPDSIPGYQLAEITHPERTYAGYIRSVNGAPFKISAITFLAVPEPSTWATMILGIGILGMSLRRRNRQTQTPAVSRPFLQEN